MFLSLSKPHQLLLGFNEGLERWSEKGIVIIVTRPLPKDSYGMMVWSSLFCC